MKIYSTTINHDARERLGLSWMEYGLGDLLFKLSANNHGDYPGWCYASKTTLAKMMGISRREIFNLLDVLLEVGLVEKHPETKHLRTTKYWYDSTIINNGAKNALPVQNVHQGSAKNAPGGSAKNAHNIETNKLENKHTDITSDEVISDKPVEASPPEIKPDEEEKSPAPPKGNLGEVLTTKYGFKPEVTQGINYPWQEKGFRYAGDLGIELKGADTGRWLKMFRQASEGRNAANIDRAYSYCRDHTNWFEMDNPARMNLFFYIFENGLDKKFLQT